MWADLIQETKTLFSKIQQSMGVEEQGQSKKLMDSLKIDLPTLAHALPYEAVDDDLLFFNKRSMGFGLQLLPSIGADEAMVKSLAGMLKNKLPEGFDCSIMLFKHHRIANQIQHGLKPMFDKGGIYKELAELSMQFHQKASLQGYPNGRNIPARLGDYKLYMFFSCSKDLNKTNKLLELREEIESEIMVAGLHFVRLATGEFIRFVKALLHPNPYAGRFSNVYVDEDFPLSEALLTGNTLYEIDDNAVTAHLSDDEGGVAKAKIINCQIERLPEQFALWQTPDFFANLLRPEQGLPCSFLITLNVRGVSQEKMLAKAKTKTKSLKSNANVIQTFLNPNMLDEARDWNTVYEQSAKGNISLLPCFYNLTLFVDEQTEREALACAIGAYRYMGFELRQSRATQWIRYLASLPFMMSEGFFKDLQTLGLTRTLTHFNIANLMPVVADTKGSPQGLLLPTHRHQIAFLDTFDNKNLPITNYNFLTVGSSGAGKSMFQQAQILSGLAMGEMTYVIDLGESYKHLCELVGGTYIDVTNITLNPFTLFDFEGKTEIKGNAQEVADYIQIRDLLAIMASPHEPISDVQKSYLLDAAMEAWQGKGKKACMDDVLNALSRRIDSASDFDQRLQDLLILLSKYGTQGVYGKLFNGDTPFVNQSNFVVFEMGGFQNNPDLLMIVMFVMIVIIQGQFYQSPRHIKKRCIIDEAWRFLCEGSNPIAANFIEQGFRTARKHNGGFGVITQYLLDTDKTIQGQAIAASSDIKIIMRQGNFNDYLQKHPNRFNALQKEMITNFGDVQSAGFSNLMIEAGGHYSFHRYFADPFTRILFSSSGEEFSAIESRVSSGMSLMEAVKEVSLEFYGEGI